jgi:nucleotide-binding universal stress UspA family protein
MFKKILLATDLSKASDAVLSCANELKQIGAEEFILFYALGIRHLDSLKYAIQDAVEPALIRQKQMLQDQGVNVKLGIARGIPSQEINKYAEANDISMIIVGSHFESATQHMFSRLGGLASEVLHHHNKPLLMPRTKTSGVNGETCVVASCEDLRDRVMFTTDFSETSSRAFTYLEKLVECGAKQITLLHVQDKTKIDKHLKDRVSEFNLIDTQRLEPHKKNLIEKGARNVEIKMPYGIPTTEILEEAKKDYSLIVMGSQGRGFVKELFLGSVSHNVARNSTVSVLLVPAPRV